MMREREMAKKESRKGQKTECVIQFIVTKIESVHLAAILSNGLK